MSNFNDPRHSFINALLENQRKKEALESRLSRWAQAPSQSEIEKCERAVRMVKAAIEADPKLATMDISVFGKGSFYNRTNIPADSDVDVGVRLNTIFNNDYPAGKVNADFDFESASYGLVQFRQDLATAMVNYFGAAGVTVGSKAIKVHSTTARVDADVVPHAVHRRYHADGSYLEGVAMRSNGKVIYNWPDQDYANGVDKNTNTARNYKAMVRILKNLRGEMEENGVFAARGVQSYLIACLVWNVPNPYLTGDTYAKMLEDCLVFLAERTSDLNNVVEWGEVNELKYLFRTSQPWTMESAHNFVTAAAAYLRSLK